mgnify:CR=1 FL=1
MDNKLKIELIDYLKSFVTKKRLELFEEKLKLRTRNITLVLEDIFQSRNMSAAIRSADCFGLQDVHIIENKNKYIADNTVSLGAGKWINIIRHNKKEENTNDCIKHLRNNGYQIIATTPHKSNISLDEIDLKNNKVAVFLGTELTGLSKEVLNNCDYKLKIPMYGFTESLNISVSAAICCQNLGEKIRKIDSNWRITEEESIEILLKWLRNSIKRSEKIEENFINDRYNY